VTPTQTPLSVEFMTTEEYYSLKETYKFLSHIIDPKKYPSIPKAMRDRAKKCLEHYPIRRDIRDVINTVDFFNPR
jgi:hypothetical protein